MKLSSPSTAIGIQDAKEPVQRFEGQSGPLATRSSWQPGELGGFKEFLQGMKGEPAAVARAILDFLLERLNCERGFLFYGSGKKEGEVAYQVASARARLGQRRPGEKSEFTDLEEPEFSLPYPLVKQAFKSSRALLCGGSPAEKEAEGFEAQRFILCQPFSLSTPVHGLVCLDRPLSWPAFSSEDLAKVEEFGKECLLVLQNAYLQQRLGELKSRLQALEDGSEAASEGTVEAEDEEKQWAGALGEVKNYHGIVAKSSKMMKIFEVVEKIKDSDFNVCILGESGTGKELLARAIHQSGKRRQGKFISENCGAISETLLESELFGLVKGAFTGADENHQGLFEVADGGTLFLDEIGDMSEGMQRKLLRVLQEGVFRPIGSKTGMQVDVRVICASNRDLRHLVDSGVFRADLYYRLNVIVLELPPLRERVEDIEGIIEAILKEIDKQEGVRRKLSESAMKTLLSYSWPGNIRELGNVLRRVLVTGSKRLVTRKEILPLLAGGPARSYVGEGLEEGENQILLRIPRRSNFNEIIEECEKAILLNALKENRWNKSRVTQVLQIPRQSLYNKIAKFNLKKKWEK
ncbi:MAG: sigma-54-dependent Fis family transcriptional regulator [Planctomycetes bacterium]|nr:sigma-54-dependent Fis family transcriptional regulator [Planctomycetota bacterium]